MSKASSLERAAFARLFLLLWALNIVPIWIGISVPGLDTPNHMARLHVLTHLDQFKDFYAPNWVFLPNLAIDLLLYLPTKVLPALVVMKGFLSFLIGLTALGFAWLNRELVGRWSISGLIGFVFSWNYVFAFGFLNYLLTLALGLCFLAAWLRFERNRFWLLGLGLPLLFCFHMMGTAMVVLALLGFLLVRRHQWQSSYKGFFAGLLACVGLVFLLPKSQTSAGVFYDSFPRQLEHIVNTFSIGSHFWDDFFLIFALALLVLAVCTCLEFESQTWVIGLGLFVVSLFAPHEAMSSAFVSARIPIWALLIGLSGARFRSLKMLSLVTGLLTIFLLIRPISVMGWTYRANQIWSSLERDLSIIPSGALVFQAAEYNSLLPMDSQTWSPALLHANSVLMLQKSVYLSNFFAFPYQQPIQPSSNITATQLHSYLRSPLAQSLPKEVERVRSVASSFRTLEDRGLYLYVVRMGAERLTLPPGCSGIVRDRYLILKINR
jgi:hypothetical protein